MSSNHNHQQPRPRSTTKARYERSLSPIPIPVQERNPEPRRPRKTSSKKQPPHRTSAFGDAPSGVSTRRDDLRSIGTWCEDIPAGNYARRMSFDVEARVQLPRAPSPPSQPYVPRLDCPDPSFLAYDTEFRVIQQDEEDGRVGNAWYIARQAKTNRQLEDALAHIARSRLPRD